MKSYTDIEQSCKLSEFLPIESADMYYFLDPTPAGNIYHLVAQRVDGGTKNVPEYDKGDIPCWSLAALMDMLPKYIEGENKLRIDINNVDFSIWYDDLRGYGVNNELPDIVSKEPVNACVTMIEKLHELKLL